MSEEDFWGWLVIIIILSSLYSFAMTGEVPAGNVPVYGIQR